VKLSILDTAEAAARTAAAQIAERLQDAIAERDRATLALSGGRSPLPMLQALARTPFNWTVIDIFQVDERVAPSGSGDRNADLLRQALLEPAAVPVDRIHLMPVEEPDLNVAAATYSDLITRIAGQPPRIDVVHLGLGADGHTASLVPGDPLLNETRALVGLTRVYQGRQRMTLTYPSLSGARSLVWLVTGADKTDALQRLLNHDASTPAGRVERPNALVFADAMARP